MTSELKTYTDPNVTLYCGDAMEVLKTLPAESVDMVMCSPPYYGLRSYKAEPVVWDSDNGCRHEWVESLIEHDNLRFRGEHANTGTNKNPAAYGEKKGSGGHYCYLCNAWRGQLGSEPTPDLYIKHLCDIFDEVKRVLKKTGTIYVNIDDSHAGGKGQSGSRGAENQDGRQERGESLNHGYQTTGGYGETRPTDGNIGVPPKSLIGIPERFVLEMLNRGWIRRNTIIWHKDSCMPESVKDRFTIDFEYVYMFSKSQRYFFERQFDEAKYDGRHDTMMKPSGKYADRNITELPMNPNSIHTDGAERWPTQIDGIRQRNKRTVWTINPQGFTGPHYATYPEELCRTPIEASCPEFICTKCGKPRVKVYETTGGTIGKSWNTHNSDNEVGLTRNLIELNSKIGEQYETEFTGLSDCGCSAEFVPGVCLDPFSGVATTGVMAKKLGRKYIGIEISDKYHKMAIKRIQETPARLI